MTRIFTVLRSGGEYRPEHVERLRRQCAVHAPGVEFVCLSDVGVPALRHDWPGWWAKIELFRFTGPILYMDLDTTVCGDLAPLLDAAQRHEFIALRDFSPTRKGMGSGLMAWAEDARWIYDRFKHDPERYMRECQSFHSWGDQGFINQHTPDRAHWQDILPGSVVSYKRHCLPKTPEGARVVCFHGNPRPWEIGQ